MNQAMIYSHSKQMPVQQHESRHQPSSTHPPFISKPKPSLALLDAFSREYVRILRTKKVKTDCADLAIEIWIQFGKMYGVPVHFRIWDARKRRWWIVSQRGVQLKTSRKFIRYFKSTRDFIRFTQNNLGTHGLIKNTYPVRGGYRHAVAGDVYLWRYYHKFTGRKHKYGHTQLIQNIVQLYPSPRIIVAQGSLPPVVPRISAYSAPYFTKRHSATIGHAPHWRYLAGKGPRRFIGFQFLN